MARYKYVPKMARYLYEPKMARYKYDVKMARYVPKMVLYIMYRTCQK